MYSERATCNEAIPAIEVTIPPPSWEFRLNRRRAPRCSADFCNEPERRYALARSACDDFNDGRSPVSSDSLSDRSANPMETGSSCPNFLSAASKRKGILWEAAFASASDLRREAVSDPSSARVASESRRKERERKSGEKHRPDSSGNAFGNICFLSPMCRHAVGESAANRMYSM